MTVALQPPPQAPPAQQVTPAQQTSAAASVAAALATAATVDQAMIMIQQTVTLASLLGDPAGLAMRAALAVVMSLPPDRLGAAGPATLAMIRTNTLRRAQFALMAARRLAQDVTDARSRGTSVAEALANGISRERRYFGQHVEAMFARTQAGARTDSAAAVYGPLLGWHAYRDSRTSPECLAADGHNFWSDAVPLIGLPGAVHPHCRCEPGQPYPGARVLPSAGARRALARAGLPA